MRDCSIRRGEPADLPFVYDLGRRTVDSSQSAVRDSPVSNVVAAFDRSVGFALGEPHTLLIAEAGGEPVGFALTLDDAPDDATMTPQLFCVYLAVDPSARRNGVGTALLAAAEEAARRAGVRYLALMVGEDNLGARAMYASFGFVTERRLLCKPL